MINVSELINDPDFAQTFTVTRTAGNWVKGRFTNTTSEALTMVGCIQPATTKDMKQLPEGDTIEGKIVIYTLTPLQTTSLNQATGLSGNTPDEISWKGQLWRVISSEDFTDYGYYKSMATRKLGA